jgi:hypothetical protein
VSGFNALLRWRLQRMLAALSDRSAEALQALGLLPALAVMLKRLVWAPAAVRDELQRSGVNVVPANFYSNIPSIEEVRDSFEYATPLPPYLDTRIFDDGLMLSFLEQLMPYAAEFDPPQDGDENAPAGFFWRNSQFSHSDAMSCYAMIRHLRPRRVLEVGSGFSTLAASAALARNGSGEIVCIEPYPRPFLVGIPGVRELIRKPVQEMPAEFFNDMLDDGDILFIDSTHTVKTGSDCLHLYLRVLPALRKRVVVHVHDVFLPDAMPQAWALEKQIYWTEQYLLLAYLLDNPRTTVWFGSHYHLRQHPEKLADFMRGRAGTGGGSFWFELAPRAPGRAD